MPTLVLPFALPSNLWYTSIHQLMNQESKVKEKERRNDVMCVCTSGVYLNHLTLLLQYFYNKSTLNYSQYFR